MVNAIYLIHFFLLAFSFDENFVKDQSILLDSEKEPQPIPNNIQEIDFKETKYSQSSCSQYYSCSTCTSINNCYWCNMTETCNYYLNTTCQIDLRNYINDIETSVYWFNNFFYQCNPISQCNQHNYYTAYVVNEDDNPMNSTKNITITIKKNLATNETCYWEFNNDLDFPYSFRMYRRGLGRDKVTFANVLSTIDSEVYVFDSEIENLINIYNESYRKKIVFYKNIDSNYTNEFGITLWATNVLYENIKLNVVMIFVIAFGSCIGIFLIFFIIRCIFLRCIRRAYNNEETVEIGPRKNSKMVFHILKNLKEVFFENCLLTEQIKCPICLFNYDRIEKIVSLPCHHFFHLNCISNWILRTNINPQCPNCKFDLFSKAKVPIPKGFNNSHGPLNQYIVSENNNINLSMQIISDSGPNISNLIENEDNLNCNAMMDPEKTERCSPPKFGPKN